MNRLLSFKPIPVSLLPKVLHRIPAQKEKLTAACQILNLLRLVFLNSRNDTQKALMLRYGLAHWRFVLQVRWCDTAQTERLHDWDRPWVDAAEASIHELPVWNDRFSLFGELLSSEWAPACFRFEFYVDGKDKDEVARRFARLEERRADIENEFSSPLEWEPLDQSRASRVACHYPDETYVHNRDQWDEVRGWTLERIGAFRKAMQPHLHALD